MIHIVGLYKCGTSWLLHALAAHPDVVAWREFDPITASHYRAKTPLSLALRIKNSLLRRPDDIAWSEQLETAVPRSPSDTFKQTFQGRGWLPVMGAEAQRELASLGTNDLSALLDAILEVSQRNVRADDAPCILAANHHKVLGHMNFRRSDLLTLMRDIRNSSSADAPALFYSALREQARPGAVTACKAADQLMHLSRLRRADPDAVCIAIIRDGRDATISARHYESLMRTQQAPWRVAQTSAARRMLSWGVRAAKLAGHIRRGEVVAVRYEDLHANFDRTCSALFEHLGLTRDASTLNTIRELTDFSVVTGGRTPGEAAPEVIRRGMVGEWRQVLSRAEQRFAWRLIGDELASFGYSPDGQVSPSPLVIG